MYVCLCFFLLVCSLLLMYFVYDIIINKYYCSRIAIQSARGIGLRLSTTVEMVRLHNKRSEALELGLEL